MAEENKVQQVTTKEPQQVTTKEPQQVTTKNLKKVEAGKRLAGHNCRKREVKKSEEQAQAQKGRASQYYGIGAVIAVGVISGLSYYIYQTKQPSHTQPNNPPKQPSPQTNKFEMD